MPVRYSILLIPRNFKGSSDGDQLYDGEAIFFQMDNSAGIYYG
jgi:hypothetical protein